MKSKQEFRRALKERRAGIPPEQKKEWDRAIVERIVASNEFQNAKTLLIYAPMEGEINLLPLVRVAWRRGLRVAFPKCDVATTTMRFYELLPSTQLVRGAYNIPEPPEEAPLCTPDRDTLCILPGLTFDPSGARLGYGKGYYDRFLADFEGVCVGAVYECMRVRTVPTEPHDRAVSLVFTERAAYRSFKKEPVGGTISPHTYTKKVNNPTPVRENTAPRPLHAPPTLCAVTFVLLCLSRLVDTHFADRNNSYVVVILLQLLIFLLPALIYLRLCGSRFVDRLRLNPIKPQHLWFSFCILAVMILGGLLTSILTGGIESLTGNFTLYDTFVARINNSFWETLYVILAYALLPALCEELIFRSILCAEYERFGVGVAIAASAIFFALLHFSLSLFLSYLVSGALLAVAMYATRSFWTAFVLHVSYNLFCLFGQPYLSAFYVHAGNNEIFVFCLITLFLLFSAFAAGEARKIYHVMAKKNVDSSYAPPTELKKIPKTLFYVCRSPATLVCLGVFLLALVLGSRGAA